MKLRSSTKASTATWISSEKAPVRLRAAARAAVAGPLSDDPIVTAGLFEMIDAYTGDDPAAPA